MNKQTNMTRLFAPLSFAVLSSYAAQSAMAQTAADYAATVDNPAQVSVLEFNPDQSVSAPAANDGALGPRHTVCNELESGEDYVLDVTYAELGDWGGTEVGFEGGLDWSANLELSFDFFGAGDGSSYQVEIREGGTSGGDSEQWRWELVDDTAGWRTVTIPFADFAVRTDWQPCLGDGGAVCDDTFTRSAVYTLVFNEPAGDAEGAYKIDSVSVDGVEVAGFNFATGQGFTAFESADTVPDHTITACGDDTVPYAGEGNNSLEITYEGQVDYGGVSVTFDGSQDWSTAETFDFWFKGAASGLSYSIDVQEGGTGTGDSEQWRASFTDDSDSWTMVSIRMTDFAARTDWQPCTGDATICDEIFARTAVFGFVINTPLGETNSYSIDSVMLNADPDMDGILSVDDTCDFTPLDEDGFNSETGCTPSQSDNDGDGVLGNVDECPDTDPTFPVGADGCYTDTDGDGVVDPEDLCDDTEIENPEVDRIDLTTGCLKTPPTPAVASTKASSSFDLLALLGLFGLALVGFRRRS